MRFKDGVMELGSGLGADTKLPVIEPGALACPTAVLEFVVGNGTEAVASDERDTVGIVVEGVITADV